MILGSAGMLGHMVYYYLKSLDKYKLVDASYPNKLHEGSKLLDVTNKAELEKFIITENPDVVVNCIGILIKGSINDPSNAIYLNSYFPHQLVKILREIGGRLIHISTDCVYSGNKGCYNEKDFRDADDTYGRSKALGEVNNSNDITLRTSIIGPDLNENGEGLFHWFMNQTGEVNGFSNVFWGGVTTLQLSRSINFSIENNLSGIRHVTNGLQISKYELLGLINSIFTNDRIKIISVFTKFTDKSLVSLYGNAFFIPNYLTMLEELYIWMVSNKNLYAGNYKI